MLYGSEIMNEDPDIWPLLRMLSSAVLGSLLPRNGLSRFICEFATDARDMKMVTSTINLKILFQSFMVPGPENADITFLGQIVFCWVKAYSSKEREVL